MKITSVKKSKEKKAKPSTPELKPAGKRSFLESRGSVLAVSVLLAILLSIGAYYGFVKNQFDRVGPGREFDLAALDSQVQARERELESLKSLQTNFESISDSDIDLVSRILPNKEQVPELLTQLEVIARQSGVSLTSVGVSTVEEVNKQSARQRLQEQLNQTNQSNKPKELETMSIQMEITAFNYLSFRQFVDSLQSHTRIMDIQRMNFSAENQFHSITVHTYYLAS